MRSLVGSVLAVLMVSGVAHAQGNSGGGPHGNTEFFFQPGAGQVELTPHLSYSSTTVKPLGGGAEGKVSGFRDIGARAAYGLNDMLSLGVDIGFTTQTTNANPETKVSGLEDPTVMLQGVTPMDMFNLRYGANFTLGFQKSKTETNGDVNVASGGLGIQPYVGADMNVGPGTVGAALSYNWPFERTTDSGGVETKTTGGGGINIAAFYEHMLADAILGGSLTYGMIGETTNTTAGGETKGDDSTATMLSLYSRIPMGTFDLLPRFDYTMVSGEAANDSNNTWALTAAGRWTF